MAAIFVFLFHFTYEGMWSEPGAVDFTMHAFGKAGWAGVSLFFVLSGFVLTWSARPDDTAPRFWRRRFAKVYPNHFVAWTAAIVLMAMAGWTLEPFQSVPRLTAPDTWLPALPNLFLIQAWFPQAKVFLSANPVAWTLACEAFFYLLFPLLYRYLRRIRPERLWPYAWGLMGLVMCMPLVAKLLPEKPGYVWNPEPLYQVLFVNNFPPVRLLEFVLGILLARILQTGRRVPVNLPTASALLVVVYIATIDSPYLYQQVATTIVPIALLILAAAAADVRGQVSPLRNRLVVELGVQSYAFYLLHYMVLISAHHLVGTDARWNVAQAAGLFVLIFAVTQALSWLMYTRWEAPLLRFLGPPPNRRAQDAGQQVMADR
ncbi:acyltransferase 3 [Streptomyces iranensis]|uniref:Acyltransferase 3 n=1 Tax=Streptomyces iranensis TaxID=576784 RepID=A0A060ZKN3_9ACTN|nr:acyltransferase 3 [Streptomyces iranensis]